MIGYVSELRVRGGGGCALASISSFTSVDSPLVQPKWKAGLISFFHKKKIGDSSFEKSL